MDAHALLTSQGWRGTGHSLHATSDTVGLSRPLLVSAKNNTLGVGKKQHKTADLWWMNAFDKTLKGLDTSKEGQVVQTLTSGGLDMVVKGGAKYVGNGGGLYASFVSGGVLGGTIDEKILSSTEIAKATKREAKAQSKAEHPSQRKDARTETKEERKARKASKRAKRMQKASAGEESQSDSVNENGLTTTETKEERRERRRQKKLLKAGLGESGELLSEKSKKKKRRKE
ncbi:hypothetical protein B0O99DRAFT_509700 [Bisporella sp. PMI_857]|nr:hypothetical protein B0O99DRAFT_509700 [Bisporella sp. PMI_857]